MPITDKDAQKIRVQIVEMQSRWKQDLQRLRSISSEHGDDLQAQAQIALSDTVAALTKIANINLPADRGSFRPDHYTITENPLKGFI